MAQRTVATSTTAAIADPNQVPFTLRAIDFKHGRPRVSVEGIAGAETVSWWVFTNGDWEELDDGAGTQVAFTATYASATFNSPGTYGYTKDATVGAITVTVDNGR
jgi:hypothetical protein